MSELETASATVTAWKVAPDSERETSFEIGEIAAALAKAQAEITGAMRDSTNPHFKSKYADLESTWDAIRGPLSKNGLAVVQFPRKDTGGVLLVTMLAHSSGQWFRSFLYMPVSKNDAQGVGSAITYARRYALQAICGVAPTDDDGNEATGKPVESPLSSWLNAVASATTTARLEAIGAALADNKSLSTQDKKAIADAITEKKKEAR
jgi:hypothetical protein